MQEGAESYLPKPFGQDLVRAVKKAMERRAGLGRQGVPLRSPRALPPKGLVGDSPAMQALFAQIGLIGPTRTTVLLLGETGTGKERLAQAIHDASPRRDEPFVAVNCAALVETVLESELFGHEKGSFSGAFGRREGRFKVADGGTIFLDEIGDISPAIQVKLLRVLQERKFERVGGNETLSVDVRVMAATNRNLREMVETARLQGRPLLSLERRGAGHSAVARAQGGHSGAGRTTSCPGWRWSSGSKSRRSRRRRCGS